MSPTHVELPSALAQLGGLYRRLGRADEAEALVVERTE
jgi:hypothetical protein